MNDLSNTPSHRFVSLIDTNVLGLKLDYVETFHTKYE
jgi:hypothetical protein